MLADFAGVDFHRGAGNSLDQGAHYPIRPQLEVVDKWKQPANAGGGRLFRDSGG